MYFAETKIKSGNFVKLREMRKKLKFGPGLYDPHRVASYFVSDQLTDGRKFRALTVVDDCTRECLALVADTSLSGLRVAR